MPDKFPKKISAMFDEIAPTYDKLNHAFTLNLDKKWRREIADNLIRSGMKFDTVLDLATGTGDLAAELLRLFPEKIVAADFSAEMLEFQRLHKSNKIIELVRADAAELPFQEGEFDLVTVGFGVRNFHELKRCLLEVNRVLKTGGMFVVIEMFRSGGILNSLFDFYFSRIMPVIGNKVSGSSNAYTYLSESVNNFLTPEEFARMCCEIGFVLTQRVNNFLGIVNTLYMKKS
ncbi:MAG: ubiquinone/menaquinone biosynthesis methyltransferase [Ignavibacteria bacterium]|nr:ubiquinone/menaquinone biosynthesis methyltransferase [Ignavibacteria bacterium]